MNIKFPLFKNYTAKIFFFQLFLLNFIVDYAIIGVNKTLMAYFSVPFLSAVIAGGEWLVLRLLWGRKPEIADLGTPRRVIVWVYVGLLILFQNILILTDYFLLFRFHTLMSQQAIDLIWGTNMAEAGEFLNSYLPWWLGILVFIVLVLLNIAVYHIAKFLARLFDKSRIMKIAVGLLVAGGIGIFSFMVVRFIKYRHGEQIPTFTAVTRLGYGYVQRLQNIKKTDKLKKISQEAEVTEGVKSEFDIVFVLGESYSCAHSPLYGYEKNTAPGMMELEADSSLIAFTDVVTVEDWTQKVLMSIFSTGRDNSTFGNHPLFPVLLKKAGWHTELYDNEFVTSPSTFFFTRPDLSAMMFDKRNEAVTRYDHELADSMVPSDSNSFYMLHLMGQHFQYIDRIPSGSGRFTPEDYDSKYTKEQRRILANYDNATLYNDSVFCSVVKRWADRDAVIVYFSDHGEEVYDCRDYFGHGNAVSAEDISYQIRVPFFVYGTETFRREHPELWQSLENARNLPITLDDVSHFFLDLAGVESPHFDPGRSFINAQYDSSRARIVLNSINFDEYRAKKLESGKK